MQEKYHFQKWKLKATMWAKQNAMENYQVLPEEENW